MSRRLNCQLCISNRCRRCFQNGLSGVGALKVGARQVHLKAAAGVPVVENDQDPVCGVLTKEEVGSVVVFNVPLEAFAQSRMFSAEAKQGLDTGEHFLLDGSAAGSSEGVSAVGRKSARKVAPVVGIVETRERDFIARIGLRDAADGEENREGILELFL